MKTNPDSTLPAAPHGPLRAGADRPHGTSPAGSAFGFECRRFSNSLLIFSLLSQDYRCTFPYFFISKISKENESPSSLPDSRFSRPAQPANARSPGTPAVSFRSRRTARLFAASGRRRRAFRASVRLQAAPDEKSDCRKRRRRFIFFGYIGYEKVRKSQR